MKKHIFVLQNEKEEALTTNVWIEMVTSQGTNNFALIWSLLCLYLAAYLDPSRPCHAIYIYIYMYTVYK